MQQSETIMFMQSLRGNQPLIVLAFLLVRAAMSIEQLEALTGLHNDTVRAAVKGLNAKGLLYKQVGLHGRQVWLPVGGTFFAKLFDQNPKTSDSTDVVVVVGLEESKLNKLTSTTTSRQNPKTSDSTLSDDQKAALKLLIDFGVLRQKALHLCALEWISSEYVRAHIEQLRGETWDNPAGMLIYRIEGQAVAAGRRSDVHKDNCNCLKCKVLKLRRSAEDNDEFGDDEE